MAKCRFLGVVLFLLEIRLFLLEMWPFFWKDDSFCVKLDHFCLKLANFASLFYRSNEENQLAAEKMSRFLWNLSTRSSTIRFAKRGHIKLFCICHLQLGVSDIYGYFCREFPPCANSKQQQDIPKITRTRFREFQSGQNVKGWRGVSSFTKLGKI